MVETTKGTGLLQIFLGYKENERDVGNEEVFMGMIIAMHLAPEKGKLGRKEWIFEEECDHWTGVYKLIKELLLWEQ